MVDIERTEGPLLPLPPDRTESIRDFIAPYLKGSQKALDRLTRVPLRPRPLYLSDQITYWRNVRSALRWLLAELERRNKE